MTILSIIVALGLIVLAGMWIIKPQTDVPGARKSEVVKTERPTPAVKPNPLQAPAVTTPATKTQPEAPVEKAKPAPVAAPAAAKPAGNSKNASKSFPDGDKYAGEMKDGILHGLGTYYYKSHKLISKKDLKNRYAEPGDYLVGEWFEGNVVSGKLFSGDNKLKEVIVIGR